MSFDKGRHAATRGGRPALSGDRRIFLTVLDEIVRSKPGLACGIVTRQGIPVLHVINSAMPRYAAEIGADFLDDDWWYIWVVPGNRIRPVDDPEGVVSEIAAALKAKGRPRP